MGRGRSRGRGGLFVALLVPALLLASPAAGSPGHPDFTELSLEQLMETEVTSVSKKAERLLDAPAAVYVITAEDIRRSGATSIPEVLRTVPGLEVARTGSHTWEISARGFRYRMANKFLVLIDGRAVYSPVYGTVLWEDQDIPLENVERIEVIRGPGATLWGTNAVNGVINIVTKAAVDTQGTLVRFHVGNEDRVGAVLRRGGMLGRSTWWRITAQGFRNDSAVLGTGRSAGDRWSGGLVEGRIDWDGRRGGRWTVQAHHQAHDRRVRALSLALSYPFSTPVVMDFDSTKSWAIVSWERPSRGGGRWSGRAWIDHGRGAGGGSSMERTTVDGLVEYAGPGGRRHQWFWGIGARNTGYRFARPTMGMSYHPDRLSDQIYSGYLQDDIVLGPGHAHLVLGTKVEYTSASGVEIQPQVRAWWRWSPAWMAWAAVSRAARTPSWMERSISWIVDVSLVDVPGLGPLPVIYRLEGSDDVRAEHQLAHEIGFRWSPGPRFSLDLAAYRNEYRGLTSFDIGPMDFSMAPIPHGEFEARYANRSRLRFHGVEVVARWRPRDRVLFEAWWSWLEGRIIDSPYTEPASVAMEQGMFLGVNPRHQVHLRTSVDLPDGWELDGSLHWTDRLATGAVPSWFRLDLRVGWHSPTRDREWSLALRNALGRHLEFRYALDGIEPEPGCVEPSLVARWTWRF